jgi:HemY protein
VNIVWHGYAVETTPGFVGATLLLFLVVWTVFYRIWRGVVTMPESFARYRWLMRRDKGYSAVTQGLVAIAAGDAQSAQKHASRAQELIPGVPLTRLLTAQTALLNGNVPAARREFISLVEDKEAAFFGLRGLLADTMAEKNYAEALVYARRAAELQPKRAWVARTLFELEAKNGNWQRAHKALQRAEKLGAVTAADALRHRQALLLGQSAVSPAPSDARKFAAAAFAMNPAFTPAALRVARLDMEAAKRRAAMKTILKAWPANPHPALAVLWQSLRPSPKKMLSVYDAGRDQFAWAEQLARLAPDHRESQRVLGLAALEGRQWREARDALGRAMDYRALARLEQQESGNNEKVAEWLALADSQPADSKWVCQQCGALADDWAALCRNCHALDEMEWMIPSGSDHGLSSSARREAQVFDEILQPPVGAYIGKY